MPSALAEEIAKVESTIVLKPEIPKLRGGQYTAIQDEDGTWCIKHLEIFSELPKGARGNDEALDKKWLTETVANMRAKYFADRQYVAPIHVNHHDRPTVPAGYFVPVEVGPCKMADGRTLQTMYVDAFKVPPAVYAEIKAGRLCFRSVEITRRGYEDHEIGSLALMADEPPHFQYAMTTIGNEILRSQQAPEAFAADKPFLFRAEKGAAFMADEEKKKKKPEGDGGGEKDSAPPFAEKEGDGKEEGTTEDGGTPDNSPQPGAEAAELMNALDARLAKLEALLTAILAMQSSGQPPSGHQPTPVQQHMKAATDEIASVKDEIEKFKAPLAGKTETAIKETDMPDPKLDAELAAIKTSLAAMQKDRETERLKAWAFKELEGFNLIAETKAYIEKYAERGEKDMKDFIEFFKKSGHGIKDPPTYTPGVGLSAPVEIPKEVVEKLATMNADEREAETEMYRAFEADAKVFGRRMPYDRFRKAEDLRRQALRIEQGGRGGLPLFTGRA